MIRSLCIASLCIAASAALACVLGTGSAQAQDCSGAPIYFNGELAEVEGELTVKSGKGCVFGLNGIPGALRETVISQKPKSGRAGVDGLKPYYVSKPGYQGSDEFAYTFIGMSQYGGPMRITVKRKVTVVP
ncbi:hypothetical protein [Microvirga lotononidis]|uniref:Uncharacterized protein n=1 Tax=Microvirga lotononidis TaxID=864069 RepID=I4YM81_9HYPH|nr:hypothetical protein [Microvirga lotononidis]EIM25073.1 hypothetical protein MicloDRAFT_00057930 [Microvirga lotononidis]WQO29437.1 hypothetical protein U0023_10365 [Microvirga lotononidis]